MYECLALALPGDGVRIEPFTLGSDPKFFNGRERSFYHRHTSKEAILELAAENAYFQRNMHNISLKKNFLILLWWILPPSGKKATKCHF